MLPLAADPQRSPVGGGGAGERWGSPESIGSLADRPEPGGTAAAADDGHPAEEVGRHGDRSGVSCGKGGLWRSGCSRSGGWLLTPGATIDW